MRYLIGNWKMNLPPSAAASFAAALRNTTIPPNVAVWVCPPAISIPATSEALRGSAIQVGLQNCHGAPQGAFTGETSAAMAIDTGCTLTLVGHSERRHIFGESIALCVERGLGALGAGLTVVFCCGETKNDRTGALTEAVLTRQLAPFLAGVKAEQVGRIIIGYEPVWAIGTGVTPTLAEIGVAHRYIIKLFRERFPNSTIPAPPVIYGGSVTPENFPAILGVPLVAGGLIGGASLAVDKFAALIQCCGR